jgi:hypothetical protein
MKHNHMNVTYDGIGFVNNRGTSKYWGVCKTLNDDKNYRITVNDLKNTYTFHPHQELGRISEETAAKLAAALYKYRVGNLPIHVNVDVDGTIYRLDAATKKIYRMVGSLCVNVEPPIDEAVAQSITAKPEDVVNRMLDMYNVHGEERQFITDAFHKMTGDMSMRGRKVLAAILRSTV